ncbi:hypothetical protein NMY22_g9582 [Coprinellus aureogranulatus]|nr:hypothetical protein NMY22_g9582 [Coprinellus aureogranulatus]
MLASASSVPASSVAGDSVERQNLLTSQVPDFSTRLETLVSVARALATQNAKLLCPPDEISQSLDSLLQYCLAQIPTHSFQSSVSDLTGTLSTAPPHSLHAQASHSVEPFNLPSIPNLPATPIRRLSRRSLSISLSSSSSSLSSPASTSSLPGHQFPGSVVPNVSSSPYLLALHPELVGTNVKVTTRLTVKLLYHFRSPGASLKYPATSAQGIGYILEVDPNLDPAKWNNAASNLAYSVGEPKSSFGRDVQKIPQLRDSNGEMVDCQAAYITCQGIKLCSNLTPELLAVTDTEPSREALREHLDAERHQ